MAVWVKNKVVRFCTSVNTILREMNLNRFNETCLYILIIKYKQANFGLFPFTLRLSTSILISNQSHHVSRLTLCDDQTPRATSPVAFCHNLGDFYPKSNYAIAGSLTEES